MQRMSNTSILPIRQFSKEILAAVEINDVIVVIGETGSGKTTQLSQILLEAGYASDGLIAVTQPRRVGAVTVAKRVAEERCVQLGQEVGYAVRFEDCTSEATRIKYLTDGTLLRECLEDPKLRRYSVIVLDEAHERSLNTDILLGLLKKLVRERNAHAGGPGSPQQRLQLVITSATLDGEKFSSYFGNCPVFNVPGRCFPVDIIHTLEDHCLTDYVTAALDTVLQIHTSQPEGDILVFLTGQAEIDKAISRLNNAVAALPAGSAGPLVALPLYASLPPEMQVRVFRPATPGVRRCIVATNVAETSITVEGVAYVVDPGVVKQKSHVASSGMDSLAVVPISRVQATQRAGRAGRTRPGKCFRLYTRPFYDHKMPNVTTPEIQRTSLVGAVLYLKSLQLGIDVLTFDFLDAPEVAALEDALRQLLVLDAIDPDGVVTLLGLRMAALPLDPALARALLAAKDYGCVSEMTTVAAMLSSERIFLAGQAPGDVAQRGRGAEGPETRSSCTSAPHAHASRERLRGLMSEGLGDHVLLLRLWEGWHAAGCIKDFARDYGLDLRGLNFALDIRRQLEAVAGPDGRGLDKLAGSGPAGGGSGDRGEVEGDGERRKRSRQEEVEERPASRRAGGQGPGDGGGGWQWPAPGSDSAGGGSVSGASASRSQVDALRRALTIGFANKLARRLPRHNGYKTLHAVGGQLAQLHPSCSPLKEDEDGLLPEFLVYHELVSTSRPFLRQVCPTRAEWVAGVLPKIMFADVRRLSGGTAQGPRGAGCRGPPEAQAQATGDKAAVVQIPEVRRNDDKAVDAARARYLSRKQQQSQAGGKAGHNR